MPEIEDDWRALRLVDSPAVSLPSDVCVFSTIPEVEAYRFAAWWMKRVDRAADTLEAAVKRTPANLDQRRMEREETYRVYLADVWDQTYERHRQAWHAAREVDPNLPAAVDGFFYRFSH